MCVKVDGNRSAVLLECDFLSNFAIHEMNDEPYRPPPCINIARRRCRSRERFPCNFSGSVCCTRKTGTLQERAKRHYCWVLAQRGGRTRTQRRIDFWCGLSAPIRYENYLAPQIARGVIAYKNFPHPIDSENRAIEAFNETAKFFDRDRLDAETLDYLAVEPADGSKDFQFNLSSSVGGKRYVPTNCLARHRQPIWGISEARSVFCLCVVLRFDDWDYSPTGARICSGKALFQNELRKRFHPSLLT